MATNGTTAKEVIMRPPPKEQSKPKTVEVGNLAFSATMIDGRPYARVHQRVEAAHEKGGYSVISRKVEDVAGIWCYCVEIELPNGQRFPGDAEIDKTQQKPIAKAQTRAIGRALAFAGFHIKSSIASEEEMEGILEVRGQTVVDAVEPDPWEPARQLAKQLGYDAQRWKALVHQQVTNTPDKALSFLQEQARRVLNERAADMEAEEDAHLIPDEMLAEALVEAGS